jgi:hypothetical protein
MQKTTSMDDSNYIRDLERTGDGGYHHTDLYLFPNKRDIY